MDRVKKEHGDGAFQSGCPVCKGECCCSNKSLSCLSKEHCYRKCPTQKNFKLAMDAIYLAKQVFNFIGDPVDQEEQEHYVCHGRFFQYTFSIYSNMQCCRGGSP